MSTTDTLPDVEEIAATVDHAARTLASALDEVNAPEPVDLVDALGEDPMAVRQLMSALARLATLGNEAAELRGILTEMGF